MPFVNELLQFSNNYFVETGTYNGDTIDIILNSKCFQKIYSLEMSVVFYENAKSKFKNNDDVKIILGNNKFDLSNTIEDINEPITFWLDAHWSGVKDIGCDPDSICPVLEELDQIKAHPIKDHTIIIDDLRLMDGIHFPVNTIDIIKKIKEINPHYSIKFVNDHITCNDILVAFINTKQCIHTYLTKCTTNPHPPGFGDFLRGTCALFLFCKWYDYTLKIDNSHPIFKFFKPNKHIVKNYDPNIVELIPDLHYQDIYIKLNDIFKKGQQFSILTTSFYNMDDKGNVTNYGPIDEDCKMFLRDILTPDNYLQDRIDSIYEYFCFDKNDEYYIIHARLGDHYLYNNDGHIDENLFNNIFNNINNEVNHYLKEKNKPIMLITDCRSLGIKLRDQPRDTRHKFIYWDNAKAHLGDLRGGTAESIVDTLVDFFLISRAKQIYYLHDSGFSRICSLIYDIEYIRLSKEYSLLGRNDVINK